MSQSIVEAKCWQLNLRCWMKRSPQAGIMCKVSMWGIGLLCGCSASSDTYIFEWVMARVVVSGHQKSMFHNKWIPPKSILGDAGGSQLNHVEPTIDLSHGPELTSCSQQEVSIGSWQYINQESESVSSTNTFQRQTVETPETSITSKNTYRIAILP